MEHDLSAPVQPGRTGRHPLPSVADAAATFARLGIADDTQVVAYDQQSGMMAARLWWMLRWLGHDQVAVLDGGWQQWQREGRPSRAGAETRQPQQFQARPRPELLISSDMLQASLHDPALRLLDARSAERYRGEHEPYDPVAGRIPGAISAPSTHNNAADGRFRPAHELRAQYQQLLGATPPEQTIMYCGSGISAAQNLLALAHAGLGDARLYAGSWSEWITDPARPIERG